jgi:protein-S-isoprenylcysteine O-methyltransferase Ste14
MNQSIFPELVLIFIISSIIRSVYEILKHKKIIKPGKISFIIIFINMVVLWTSWFLLCGADPSEVYLPDYINYFGISLVIIGVIIFLAALFTIKTLETYEGDLITNGIYSKIRHPMYLGFIFWSIGMPVYFGAVYSFIISIAFDANILFWRYLEEKELAERFVFYKEYKLKTYF